MRPAGGLGVVAPAPEVVGADRADDRRAGVLGDDEAAQRPGRERLGGVEPDRRAVGNALRIDRDRAARRQRHALRALRADAGIGQRLLAEEDEARIAADHLVDAGRVRARPGADRRPRRLARRAARPARSASGRPTGTAGRCAPRRRRGRASARRRARSRRRGGPSPAPAGGARRGGRAPRRSRCRAGSSAPPAGSRSAGASSTGLRRRQVGGRRVERDPKAGPRDARRLDERLEVAGREADRVALDRFDPVRPQLALQPIAHRRFAIRGSRAALARLRAGVEPARRRPLAAAQEGGPEVAEPIAVPAGQVAPARGDPARARPLDRRRGEVVAAARRTERRRRAARRRGAATGRRRRQRRARAGGERRRGDDDERS